MPNFETLGYWDGILSALFVDQRGQLWFLSMQGENAGSREPRVYDAWKLFKRPTDAELEDPAWRPATEPWGLLTESFVRSVSRYEHA